MSELAPTLDLPQLHASLVQQGLFDPDVLQQAMPSMPRHLPPLQALGMAELIDTQGQTWDEACFTRWYAEQIGWVFQRIDPLATDVAAVTGVMSAGFAQSHNILALSVSADTVTVAVVDPRETRWISGLEQVSKRRVVRVLSPPSEIARHRTEFYALSQSIGSALQRGDVQRLSDLEQLLDLSDARPSADDQSIVEVVDWVLRYAFEQRASDIHVEPRRDQAKVRMRIDGVLHSVYQMPAQIGAAIVSRFKALGRMDVAEKRQPQDGRLKTRSPRGREIELRLSTLPTAFGEKLVARIFDPEVLQQGFDELGFGAQELQTWRRMTARHEGIVLVTGPTGSGKTTTLYATLRELASEEVNLCTVEDPIELIEPAFNQVQVQHSIGLDFAAGMKSLLRQDPDIIMVGEIRDRETADMAIQAALTGHLVVSTLHTNDAPSAVTRLLELGVPAYLLRATLIGVMAQRLTRTLCAHCKQPTQVDTEAWSESIAPFNAPAPEQIWQAEGCEHCRQTGYSGRAGIYELLELDDALRQGIHSDTSLEQWRAQAWQAGMTPLRVAGARRVAAGLTTLEEVSRVTPGLS
ncbi:MAG: GspE/PulE family protein [Litorivicinus sp.]